MTPGTTAAAARLDAERRRTTQRLERLRRDHAGFVEASLNSNADDEHDPEGATVGFERAQLTALLATARERIAEVDDALRRVDAGTYGTCERCGHPIAAERLAARPFARFCITCA